MSGGMYLAAAGALVQQLRLEVLSNNVANINTTGYKSDRSIFQIPEGTESQVFETPIDGIQTLSPYAPPFSTEVYVETANVNPVQAMTEMIINGDGFFSVQTPDGVQYTRQGSFTMDPEGVLVTPDGYPVLGEGGEITLEEGTVEIDREGGVYVDGDEVGRLQITDFLDRNNLKKAGNGRFVASDRAIREERPETTTLSQGFVETANVNPVQAMTEMIETSRAFEAYQKVIQSADEATAKSINDVGKTA